MKRVFSALVVGEIKSGLTHGERESYILGRCLIYKLFSLESLLYLLLQRFFNKSIRF
ncbi:hypothetical protein HMPREF9554_03048 [Treponema phagedenis F0421]|nr:hypothetical protein HMPREF9554_03048 [Treponema phagedenis F0421]